MSEKATGNDGRQYERGSDGQWYPMEEGGAPPDASEAALRGLAQGLTADWSDEIAGAVDYGKAALNNKPTEGVYKKGRDESRQANKRAEEAHPTAYGVAHLAGTVGAGAATLPLGMVPGAALLGAASASGASESDDPTQLIKETALGAAGGAAAGAAGQLAGKVAKMGLQGGSKVLASLSDTAAARAVGGTADKETAAVLTKMMTDEPPGSLSNRISRLKLMDNLSWQSRREAAQVGLEKNSQDVMGVLSRMDEAGVEPPSASAIRAGMQTHPDIVKALQGPDGVKVGVVAQNLINPLSHAHTWKDFAVTLDQMADVHTNPFDQTVIRAARGVFDKAAQDAAERSSQEILGAQMGDLVKDRALLNTVLSATTKKIESGIQNPTRATRLAGMLKDALQNSAAGAGATAKVTGGLSRAMGGKTASVATKASGPMMGRLSRLVVTSGDDVAASIAGKSAARAEPRDDLKIAAAHMVAQQSPGPYQKKAGELAEKLSKEKPPK